MKTDTDQKMYEIAELYKMIREAQKKAYELSATKKGLEYREAFNQILESLDTARSMTVHISNNEGVR